jgi:ATP-dependent Clp protease ATP-binding subunit ClpA
MMTQEAINQWHTEKLKLTLLLFDEIEKASDALWQLLLGIMDKATLTLGDNRRVDLSQCLIILTSNLGAGEMMSIQEGSGMGFKTGKPVMNENYDARINDSAVNAARKKFTPEFMNRIDKVVVFNTLRDDDLRKILEIELGLLQQRILHSSGGNQFTFACSQTVKDKILADGTDAKYGARELKRAIERNLTFPMANMVASGQIKLGDFIRIDMEGEEMIFVKEAENTLVPDMIESLQKAAEPEAAARAHSSKKKVDLCLSPTPFSF